MGRQSCAVQGSPSARLMAEELSWKPMTELRGLAFRGALTSWNRECGMAWPSRTMLAPKNQWRLQPAREPQQKCFVTVSAALDEESPRLEKGAGTLELGKSLDQLEQGVRHGVAVQHDVGPRKPVPAAPHARASAGPVLSWQAWVLNLIGGPLDMGKGQARGFNGCSSESQGSFWRHSRRQNPPVLAAALCNVKHLHQACLQELPPSSEQLLQALTVLDPTCARCCSAQCRTAPRWWGPAGDRPGTCGCRSRCPRHPRPGPAPG